MSSDFSPEASLQAHPARCLDTFTASAGRALVRIERKPPPQRRKADFCGVTSLHFQHSIRG
jgi:hypothetical protein